MSKRNLTCSIREVYYNYCASKILVFRGTGIPFHRTVGTNSHSVSKYVAYYICGNICMYIWLRTHKVIWYLWEDNPQLNTCAACPFHAIKE